MGLRIIGFILYLAVSYGAIYFLVGTKRSAEGSNAKELLANPVLIAAVIAIIAVGAMLVGPFTAVFLAVALFAFIAYLRSSDVPPLDGVTARELLVRMGPLAIRATALLRRGLEMGLAYGSEYAKRPALVEARRTLTQRVEKLQGYVQSHMRKPDGKASKPSSGNDEKALPAVTRAEPEPVPAPVLTLAEGHGLDAVRAALAQQKPAELSRDQAKRLLDHLEGR
jgi:hypothetical protein